MSARRRQPAPASIGAKLVMVLTAVGLAGALGITLVLASVITPSFDGLEQRAVATATERAQEALADYAGKVEAAARDLGDHPGDAAPATPAALDVQGLALVAPDGRIAVVRSTGDDRAMRAALSRIDFTAQPGATRFYARMGSSLVAIGVAPVRGQGGRVALARVLTPHMLATLVQPDARIDFAARPDTVRPGATSIGIAVPVAGVDGRAIARLRFAIPRDITLLGRRMLLLAVAGSTLLLLIVLMVLRRMIAGLVLRPLQRVEQHMQRVRASGSLGLLDDDDSRDEIGSLGRSFNAMLSQLKDLREQIEVQSFALGRTESAIAVMHNVRNALNPISTIISQGIAQAPPIDRATVDRALAELVDDALPAARRQKLAAFVAAALAAEVAGRELMRRELEVGREAMAQVLEIIGQQQARAHERPPLEACDVGDIVARNATVTRYSHDASIAFSFPAGRHMAMANRVILSQVIGNLLGNAAEAIAARGTGSGSIAVTIEEAGDHVVLAIRDDGEGFDAAVGATLFQRGFSTRSHKSGGLGLHWCANSMTAMDGSLRLESEGRGRGAQAILTLQAAAAEALAA